MNDRAAKVSTSRSTETTGPLCGSQEEKPLLLVKNDDEEELLLKFNNKSVLSSSVTTEEKSSKKQKWPGDSFQQQPGRNSSEKNTKNDVTTLRSGTGAAAGAFERTLHKAENVSEIASNISNNGTNTDTGAASVSRRSVDTGLNCTDESTSCTENEAAAAQENEQQKEAGFWDEVAKAFLGKSKSDKKSSHRKKVVVDQETKKAKVIEPQVRL